MSEQPAKNRTVADVIRIKGLPGQNIISYDDISNLVEEPLVNAVRILLGKGVVTSFSTANLAFSFASIVIEPESLSVNNLKLAREKFHYTGKDYDKVMLQMDIDPNTPIEEVDGFFVRLANLFEDQQS